MYISVFSAGNGDYPLLQQLKSNKQRVQMYPHTLSSSNIVDSYCYVS